MKIAFAGSPAYALPPLKALYEGGYEIVAVITQPDKPVGRKRILLPTPIKEYALEKGIKVCDFARIRDHEKEVAALGADIMITCAYGQILSEGILGCFPKGVWNLHASLLPKFRGASPVQSAILAGESHTGVTVMKTEPALDSGDILLVKRCEVGDKTCGELSVELSRLSAEAALEAVKYLEEGNVQLLMQDEAKASFCKKISKEDCRLGFFEPAASVLRKIKAFSPQPAAYCFLNGSLVNVLNAEPSAESGKAGEVLLADKSGITVACGENSIRITYLQPAGGKAMPARDFVNGRKIKAGDILD